jgi:hypothetical protein
MRLASPFDRLTGQLPFAIENRREKYLIIHTTDQLLRKVTPFTPSIFEQLKPPYVPTSEASAHAPNGVVFVELRKPEDLVDKLTKDDATDKYEEAKIGQLFYGNGFIVTTPELGGYRVRDTSGLPGTNIGDEISASAYSFRKFAGSGIRDAFVRSWIESETQNGRSSEDWLDFIVEQAKTEYANDLEEEELHVLDDFTLLSAKCRRIDISGKRTDTLFLPVKGYNITCVHPGWEGVRAPLIVQIGAFYYFGIDEIERLAGWSNAKLPDDLSEFYEHVQFVKE